MWIYFALAAAILFATNSILGRVLATKSANPRAFALIYNTIGGIFALSFFLFDHSQFSGINWQVILLLAINICVYGIFNRFEFYARKDIEASTYAVLAKVTPIITFTLSIIFLQETLNLNKILALFVIIAGNILAVMTKKGLKFSNGLKYVALVVVSLGVAWTFDKKISGNFPLPLYAFFTYMLPNIFIYFFPKLTPSEIKNEFKIANYRIFILAIINVCGYFMLIKAYSFGEASNIVLLTSTSTIITVLLGIFLLKEKDRLWQKILAAVLVTIGVLLLK
ncbi:MAG: DMT family transporter [Candidatus Shapirobacteria bacterium]|jgi:uncharacterized membrane protein